MPMLLSRLSLITCLLIRVLTLVVSPADCYADDSRDTESSAGLISTYCVDCHNSAEANAELNLETFRLPSDGSSTVAQREVGEKIVRRLRARQMPPADADRPTEAEYLELLASLEGTLDQHAAKHPQPGRTDSLRRLNRTEYRNAIRDLLGVNIDVDSLLPADELSHGFDNVTVGELSPVLLNRFIIAAEKISRQAVGGGQRSPGGITHRLPADRSQEAHVPGLPLGTRGGMVFEYQFPADGEYEIQLRLMRDRDEHVEGLTETHAVDVLLDRQRVHRFTIAPAKGQPGYAKDDGLVDAHLKKRFRATAGPHKVGVTFPRKFASLLEIKRQPFDASYNHHRHPRRTPALFQVSLTGPFDPGGPGETPSRRRIFGNAYFEPGAEPPTNPKEATAQAEEILQRIMRLAYRRPVTSADLQLPMQFFQERFSADGFEAGVEAAITVVLVNPHFLFRTETDPANTASKTAYRINDIELATRLSFFLWSSLPDETLLQLAEQNRLHQPDELQKQVQRMLKDPRAESLVENFAAQWLYLRNLQNFEPDKRLFPDFDDNLRSAFRKETELHFADVLQHDRSVLDLIRTDTTFLNERLARHYDIPGVLGSQFRAVPLDASSHRGGLLRQGSILAVTSYATRTSPTIRGNWILENILGTPPPPPPPNVPSLKEKTATQALTIRARLAEHRANPACASCHNLMDPVGFSLENFDAVGRWRRFDAGEPVDAAGALPDGTRVNNLKELEAGILARPQMFVGTLAEKLLTFALGRGIEPADGPAVRQIVSAAATDKYRFSSLIQNIVLSPPFQMRVTP